MNLFHKFKGGLQSLLQQGPSEQEFNGDLVYNLKKKMLVVLNWLGLDVVLSVA